MRLGLKKNTVLSLATLSCVLALSSGYTAPEISYAGTMGDEKWRMSGNQLRCGLAINIPNYGMGYFEQAATKQPHFVLRKWQDVQRTIPTRIIAKSPVWKPDGQAVLVTQSYLKPGKFGFYLDRDPTLKLLNYLQMGYQANFVYQSEQGFNVNVALSPIRFKKMYGKYIQCVGNLLPYGYEQVKESVFHFGIDSKELSWETKLQLKRIAKYVSVDHTIEKIRVSGYADESGRKGYNNAVSQYRAQAVQKYLLKMGVHKEKLSVTWFGALKPVDRNDTDAGRAANRRVVVDLIKK